MKTTREEIVRVLRDFSLSVSELAVEVDSSRSEVVEHVSHISQSLSTTDETLYVAPPECQDCGFDAFDNPANDPSRCPSCKGEQLSEPVFTIR